MAQRMMDFINRPEEAKSMKAFELVSRTNSEGEIEIKPSWHKWTGGELAQEKGS
jgi:hypothetical protein